ncbi:hypothetical protein ACSVDM_04595 [Nocardia sp. JW2]|uniref:hypothetical protein n=1 Tax=Nocardia sp. JW2 TaxID=3450738 RepID=UPI003F43BB67
MSQNASFVPTTASRVQSLCWRGRWWNQLGTAATIVVTLDEFMLHRRGSLGPGNTYLPGTIIMAASPDAAALATLTHRLRIPEAVAAQPQ